MKAIIYGRLSRADREVISAQVDILKRYCKRQ